MRLDGWDDWRRCHYSGVADGTAYEAAVNLSLVSSVPTTAEGLSRLADWRAVVDDALCMTKSFCKTLTTPLTSLTEILTLNSQPHSGSE